MRLLLAALTLAAATTFAPSFANAEAIKIGTEAAYAPFNYFDDSGKIAGYDIDVGNEICKRAALECTWVANEWDSIIPNLVSGNYDAIMADVTITDERKQTVDFSHAYFPPDPSQYLHLATKTIDYDNMKGLRIGVQKGTVQAIWLDKTLKDGNTILTYDTTDQALADVNGGNIDLMIAEGSYINETVDATQGLLVTDGPKVPIGDGAGVAFRKADTDMRKKFDDAIDAMKADGTIDKLIAHWFPQMGPGPYFLN